MRQEVISTEEAKENEVIYYPLKVKFEWQFDIFEFKVEVLSDYIDFDELEGHHFGQTQFLAF